MNKLEDLRTNAAVKGILPDALVTVVSTQWFGSEALELTYKTAAGKPPGPGGTEAPGPAVAARPKRYYGTVVLDSTRVGRDASRVADEVISHLSGLVGAKVKVTLEIEAQMPDGASEQTVRTVTENGRTLKFTNHGFETD